MPQPWAVIRRHVSSLLAKVVKGPTLIPVRAGREAGLHLLVGKSLGGHEVGNIVAAILGRSSVSFSSKL